MMIEETLCCRLISGWMLPYRPLPVKTPLHAISFSNHRGSREGTEDTENSPYQEKTQIPKSKSQTNSKSQITKTKLKQSLSVK